jgi:RimJ/RimL family protein N-acetyltransferase
MATGETATELTEREAIDRFVGGTLPERWWFRLQRPLRPLYQEGQRVLVGRGLRRAGALVWVMHHGRLAWRRAIARSDEGVLLRAEVSPFVDGWFSEIVGSIEPAGLPAILAERLPKAWTRLWWTAAWLRSRTLGLHERARRPRGDHPPYRVRRLSAADRDGYLGLVLRAYGSRGVLAHQAEFPPPNAIGLGLFLGDTLVGVGWLRRNQDLGVISSLVVDSRYRGRGGGTQLYRAALSVARAAGMRRAQAAVSVRNLPSLRAAERAGLRRTGRWVSDPVDRLRASDLQQQILEVELPIP